MSRPLAIVAAALGIGLVLQQFLGVANIALVFLTGVLVARSPIGLLAVALRLPGQRARLQFLLPAAALHLHHRRSRECRRAVLLPVVAVIASNLAGAHARPGADGAQPRARPPRSSTPSAASSPASPRSTICSGRRPIRSPRCSRCASCCCCRDGDSIAVRAGYPPEDQLDDADLAAAQWTWEHNRAAGRGADTLPGAKRLFLPMRTGRGADRRARHRPRRAGAAADARRPPPARRAGRSGGARDRAHQPGRGHRPRASSPPRPSGCARRCLTSISHDLRTPLASIIGSLTSLRSYGDAL